MAVYLSNKYHLISAIHSEDCIGLQRLTILIFLKRKTPFKFYLSLPKWIEHLLKLSYYLVCSDKVNIEMKLFKPVRNLKNHIF